MKAHLDAGFMDDTALFEKEKTKPFMGIQKRNALMYRQREAIILTFLTSLADDVFKIIKMKHEDAVVAVTKMPEDPMNKKFYFISLILPLM